MKKLLPFSAILFCLVFFGNTTNSKAQGLFYAQSATMSTNQTDSCSGLSVDVLNWMGCINFQVGPGTFTISGNTINVDVNCTSSPICAGAISQPLVNVTIPSLPAGTYTVNGRAFLDRTLVNSVSAGTLTVISCNTVGMQEASLSQVKIGPNPASEFVSLKGLNLNQPIQYEIIDLKGSLIKSGGLEGNRISLSEINPGLYFVRLSNISSQVIHRIVIHRN